MPNRRLKVIKGPDEIHALAKYLTLRWVKAEARRKRHMAELWYAAAERRVRQLPQWAAPTQGQLSRMH